MDITANFSECIQKSTSIGSTVYYNVCTNTSTTVPWGSADWIAVIGVTVFLVLAGIIVLAMMSVMLRS